MLQREGLDLTWDPGEGESEAQVRQRLALYAQAFASTRLPGSRHKGEIAPATKNQRLAILSSFYQFANKGGFLTIGNPIDLVDRSPVQPYARAYGLEQEEVQERLLKIDVTSKAGLRDFALLLVLFTTGRRAGEVASLRRRHLLVNRRGIVTLDFERCKGAKSTRDTLDEVVSTVLILQAHEASHGSSACRTRRLKTRPAPPGLAGPGWRDGGLAARPVGSVAQPESAHAAPRPRCFRPAPG